MTIQLSFAQAMAELRKLRARKLARKRSRGIVPTIFVTEAEVNSGRVRKRMMAAVMKKIR